MTDRPWFGVWADVLGDQILLAERLDFDSTLMERFAAEIIPRVERLTARNRRAS